MKDQFYPMISNGLISVYNYPKIIRMQSQEPITVISRKQNINGQYNNDTIKRALKKNRTTNK